MCPQCGKGNIKQVEGATCEFCGFRYIASKELGECSPRYCQSCGCTYLNGCSIHNDDVQSPLFPK